MDPSDSDCFESADEDFQSDDDDTPTIKKGPNNEEVKAKPLKNPKLPPRNSNQELRERSEQDTGQVPNKLTSQLEQLSVENEETFVTTKNLDEISQYSSTTPPEQVVSKASEKITNIIPKPSKIGNKLHKLPSKTKLDSTQHQDLNQIQQCKNDREHEFKSTPAAQEEEEVTTTKEDNLWDDTEIVWGQENDEDNVSSWDNNDWEPLDAPKIDEKSRFDTDLNTKSEATSTNTWSNWGTWGMSSILSTATQGVSSLTQGISTVLESGMGVPNPEELAQINKDNKEKLEQSGVRDDGDDNPPNQGFGINNFVMGVSHLTKLVETTGTKVISGGLDTLESIGKKTMEVLQEGDPGLKKKRAFLKIEQDKPVLSQLLREAKEKAEQENEILERKHYAKKAKNYETLFDDHQGLVHLEALEMLSKQCDIKLQTLLESYSDDALTELQETMDQVKELCELPSDDEENEHLGTDDIGEKLGGAVRDLGVPISYTRLIDTWSETEEWLKSLQVDVCDERELHQQSIENLAQLTAIAVEQFHKAGELLLVKEHRSTADEADSLVQLTTTLTSLIGLVAAKFSDTLNAKSTNSKHKDKINSLITNVFYEAANSSSYIQDAFQLLIPVLQVGAV